MLKEFLQKASKKFLNITSDNYTTYFIKPDSSVRNQRTEDILKVVAGLYEIPINRIKLFKNGSLFTLYNPDSITFTVLFELSKITFYLTLPNDKKSELLRKCESIWPNATILPIEEPLPSLNPNKTAGAYLHYRRHDLFSMACDDRDNLPLPSLLVSVRELEEESDIAVLSTVFEPKNSTDWERNTKKLHKKMEHGHIPVRPGSDISYKVFEIFTSIMNGIRYELLELAALTPSQRQAVKELKEEEKRWSEGRKMYDNMSSLTNKKQDDDVVKTSIRVAAQSNDIQRAQRIVRTICNSWKDIAGDNELERKDIRSRFIKQFLVDMEKGAPIRVNMYTNVMTTKEAGKILQIPGLELQKQYPEVQAVKIKESSTPNDLYQETGIRLGYVTERGITKLARKPIKEYNKIPLKLIYDALCTALFAQGKQGTGKTVVGINTAYDFVINGFTAIVIDTADGQMIKDLEDALPEDYPEWKLVHINCDNKAWPISLNWSDVLGREFKSAQGDTELQSIEIQERITTRFLEFINGEATNQFSDPMKQYLVSCMKAVTVQPMWSFQDFDLALTSPAYREELLADPKVQNMPEAVADLMRLQDMAEKGTTSNTVDGILARLRMLSNSKLLANMFYQLPKLDENGKPVLDFRKIMDNNPTGDPVADKYGYLVTIQASYDAWQEQQSLILGFFEDKINFNVFSRIELDQSERQPVLKWIDEPHKVIKSVAKYYQGSNVEFRKYRCANLFTGHSIEQMGDAANSLLDGGAQIISFKTERLSELERFAHTFEPYTDAGELYHSLPDCHKAVTKIRLAGTDTCPAFIAHMVAPPEFVKDRSARRQECAEYFGRHWKEVSAQITGRRLQYQKLDNMWFLQKLEEEQKAKKSRGGKK